MCSLPAGLPWGKEKLARGGRVVCMNPGSHTRRRNTMNVFGEREGHCKTNKLNSSSAESRLAHQIVVHLSGLGSATPVCTSEC